MPQRGFSSGLSALRHRHPYCLVTSRDATSGTNAGTKHRTLEATCLVPLLRAARADHYGHDEDAPGKLVTALAWFTTIYAAVGVVLNLTSRSSPERAVFAPTAILLFASVSTWTRRTRK